MVVSWYGTKPATLQLGGHFHRGRVRIVSSQVGRINPALFSRWDKTRRSWLVNQLLNQLPLSLLVSHRFRFEQAPAVYRLVDERPGEALQVIFTYGEEGG